MKLEVIRWEETQAPSESDLRERLEGEGFSVWRWSDSPAATYTPHRHDHDESLWLVEGEIAFGVGEKSYSLKPGDRLMLPKGTVHTAKAGPDGATYLIGER